MSVVWYKILVHIDVYDKVIQAGHATLYMEVANIERLFEQLVALRDSWKAVWNEAKLVASSLQREVKLVRDQSTTARERTRYHDKDAPDENMNEMMEASPLPTYFNHYWKFSNSFKQSVKKLGSTLDCRHSMNAHVSNIART